MTYTEAPCPSRDGYYWHLRHDEDPCDECRAANTAYHTQRRRAAGMRPQAEISAEAAARDLCGTTSGYARHHVNRTPYCQPCRDANAAAQRKRRKR